MSVPGSGGACRTAHPLPTTTIGTCTLISRQPGIGSPRYAVEVDWPGLRTLQMERFPYLVFHLEQAGHRDVLHVLHGHRGIAVPDESARCHPADP